METKYKVLILTVAVAIPAFILSAGSPPGGAMWRAIWPWGSDVAGPGPGAALLPLYMILGLIEALSLGLAVSYVAFGWQATKDRLGVGVLFCLCITWALGNWWMHDSIHQVNGEDFVGLAVIEYLFHVTLIAAGAYVAWVLARKAGRAKAT